MFFTKDTWVQSEFPQMFGSVKGLLSTSIRSFKCDFPTNLERRFFHKCLAQVGFGWLFHKQRCLQASLTDLSKKCGQVCGTSADRPVETARTDLRRGQICGRKCGKMCGKMWTNVRKECGQMFRKVWPILRKTWWGNVWKSVGRFVGNNVD